MIVPLKGVYKCLLNDVELSLRPGELLLVQPDDVHQDIYLPGMEYCGSIFDVGMQGPSGAARRIFRSGADLRNRVVRFKGIDSILRVKESFSVPGGSDSIFNHYRASATLQAVFWEALSAVPRKMLAPEFISEPERDAFRKRLLLHFEANIKRRLKLDDMARVMGISKSGVSHKCVELLGSSPAKAFLDFRLEKAKSLLQDSGLSVKETCLALGFISQFHFSRAFKKRFGVPPSALR